MQTWPDGYQGDFRAVEYIATGINRAPPDSFAFSLQQAMLHSGVVQQHRYKLRRRSETFLNAIVAGVPHPRLLSIGCGGCRDLIPLLHVLRQFTGDLVSQRYRSSCTQIAADRLQAHTDRIRPLCANVTSLVRLLRPERAFELIMAGGLFDYIPDRLLIHLLKDLYRDVLAPGGLVLFTNIADGNPSRPLMTYAVDWQLIERSEQGIRDLCGCALIPAGAMELEREESQLTWRVRLHKPVSARVSVMFAGQPVPFLVQLPDGRGGWHTVLESSAGPTSPRMTFPAGLQTRFVRLTFPNGSTPPEGRRGPDYRFTPLMTFGSFEQNLLASALCACTGAIPTSIGLPAGVSTCVELGPDCFKHPLTSRVSF